MKIYEPQQRTPQLLQKLMEIWEESVRASHLFLSNEEIEHIRNYVPQALISVPHIIIAEQFENPVAFMGIAENRLEMLFLATNVQGIGLGKQLLGYAIQHYAVRTLTVNEQNPKAVGFYQHMGFKAYKRTDYDEEGNPYPLLYMSLNHQEPY